MMTLHYLLNSSYGTQQFNSYTLSNACVSVGAAVAWCQNVYYTHKLGSNDFSKAKVTGKYRVGVRYIRAPTKGNKLMVMYPADYKKELKDENDANATWI